MRMTKRQLVSLVENYLSEQDNEVDDIIGEPDSGETESKDDTEEPAEDETESAKTDSEEKEEDIEIPDISFKVKKDDQNVDIELKSLNRDKPNIKTVFVDGKQRTDIDPDMETQIVAAHGMIHPSTTDAAKEVLQKILRRDKDFIGKSESGMRALIADKMSTKLGAQSLGMDKLRDLLDKG